MGDKGQGTAAGGGAKPNGPNSPHRESSLPTEDQVSQVRLGRLDRVTPGQHVYGGTRERLHRGS